MGSEFQDKKKALFDSLISAEGCLKGTSLEQKETSHSNTEHKREPKDVGRRFQGKESIFKRPTAPISKCLRPRIRPDYQLNPHKWKKYSLEDADISDNTNASAAFAFLSEIEKRKQPDNPSDTDADAMDAEQVTSGKAVFNQRRNLKFNRSIQQQKLRAQLEQAKIGDSVEDRVVLRGSKVLMPEYVVGQKSAQKSKQRKPTSTSVSGTSSQKQLKLQHLMDEAEDEDD